MPRRSNLVSLAAALAFVYASMFSVTAHAENARIHFNLYKAGFIVGVSGGKGSVTFHGKRYPISIGGVSLGATIGASKAELTGVARGLHNIHDIEGTYTAAQAGLAMAGGGKVAQLQNSRDVTLNVRGRQIGFEFSVDLSGMEVRLR
jgi:hypothetical protein